MSFTTKNFGAIAAAALAVAATSANAAFEYDLLFSDTGLSTATLDPAGGTFTLTAFAVVTGTIPGRLQAAGTGNLALFSQQINGGVATGGGVDSALPLELASGARAGVKTSILASGAGWTDPVTTQSIPNTGVGAGTAASVAPYSVDGIEDWGSYAPVAGNGSQGNNAANLRYVGDDTTFAGAFGGAGRRAGATTGTANVPVAEFVISFSAAQVAAAPASGAATRFRLEIPYRTNTSHGGQLTWWENQATNSTSFSATSFNDTGVGTASTSFATVRAAYGQQFVANAFVDFVAPVVTPSAFIDLVGDGDLMGATDLGDAVQAVVLDIVDSSSGYVDIIASNSPGNDLSPITYVALDINGASLPNGFSIVGGTDVTGTAIGQDILAAYGSGLEVVFAFTQLGDNVKFDLGGVLVDKILVVPEPTSVAALALGGLVALRRRRA